MTLTTVISQPRPVGSATSQARRETADPNAFSDAMGAQSNQAANDDGGSEGTSPTVTATWSVPAAGLGPEDISGLPVEPEDQLNGLPFEESDELSGLPVEPEDEISGLPFEPEDGLSGLPVEAQAPVAEGPVVRDRWVSEATAASSGQGVFTGDMAFETMTSLLGRYAASPAVPYQAATK